MATLELFKFVFLKVKLVNIVTVLNMSFHGIVHNNATTVTSSALMLTWVSLHKTRS